MHVSDADMDHLTHILPSSSSQNSSPAVSTPDSSTSMTRTTTSLESTKGGKRKGTRSVSTLTPAQLARKRANDREAQRAIRARTKEHIENLQREIDELRSQKSRDQTVQELLGRNRALEDEVRRLSESLGIRTAAASGMPSYPTCTYSAILHRGILTLVDFLLIPYTNLASWLTCFQKSIRWLKFSAIFLWATDARISHVVGYATLQQCP